MFITLTGNPISTGTIYRHACRGSFPTVYMSKRGKERKVEYKWEAKAQWKGKPLQGDVKIEVDLYFGTKRIVDWDNFHKLSMDALTGIVWEDDSQIIEATVRKYYRKANPRIVIKLW